MKTKNICDVLYEISEKTCHPFNLTHLNLKTTNSVRSTVAESQIYEQTSSSNLSGFTMVLWGTWKKSEEIFLLLGDQP